jgi:hypothetical protein
MSYTGAAFRINDVAAVCAGPTRRYGRQRRARLVNITPTAGDISVGPYSNTTVPARRIAPGCTGASKRVRSTLPTLPGLTEPTDCPQDIRSLVRPESK